MKKIIGILLVVLLWFSPVLAAGDCRGTINALAIEASIVQYQGETLTKGKWLTTFVNRFSSASSMVDYLNTCMDIQSIPKIATWKLDQDGDIYTTVSCSSGNTMVILVTKSLIYMFYEL